MLEISNKKPKPLGIGQNIVIVGKIIQMTTKTQKYIRKWYILPTTFIKLVLHMVSGGSWGSATEPWHCLIFL